MGEALIVRRGGINQSQNQTYYWRVWRQGEQSNDVEYIKKYDHNILNTSASNNITTINYLGQKISIEYYQGSYTEDNDIDNLIFFINDGNSGYFTFYDDGYSKTYQSFTLTFDFSYTDQQYRGLMFEYDNKNKIIYTYAIKDSGTFNPTTWTYHNIAEGNDIILYPINGYEWNIDGYNDKFYFEFFGPVFPPIP